MEIMQITVFLKRSNKKKRKRKLVYGLLHMFQSYFQAILFLS